MIQVLHNHLQKYRVSQLANTIANLIQPGPIIDIGSGDGKIAAAIRNLTGYSVEGCDILIRSDTAIPTQEFDGRTLPFNHKQFQTALLIDVLHHDSSPDIILKEALRVAKVVIIKDHINSHKVDYTLLKYMDNVGNKRYGVALPYNYLSRDSWFSLFSKLNVEHTQEFPVTLYSPPISWAFPNRLQTIFKLT